MKVLLTIFFISSCASLFSSGDKENIGSKIQTRGATDYVDHFANFKDDYLQRKDNFHIKISNTAKSYLKKISRDILQNNKIFFEKKGDAEIYLINDNIPFHFSLPGRKVFISSGLFTKYIKNESLLYCVLMFELIRSEKNIYKKSITIPTGAKDTREILALLRLSIKDKVEVHKWAIKLLKKNGIDSDTYLSWLQIQNRNSLDFSNQLGDINTISREEALFKDFIIKNSRNEKREYKRSSGNFYALLRELRSNI